MNAQWCVHWGCNYHELLALLKKPSSVHIIGAYCKWQGLSTKDPKEDIVQLEQCTAIVMKCPLTNSKVFSKLLLGSKKIAVSMPNVVSMYNHHMGGVDRLDENISLYSTAIPGKKWYFLLFCYFLNVCVKNAWLFARKGDYSDDMRAFTPSIVQCWLTKYGILAKKTRQAKIECFLPQ